ncbi:hypothetical protein TD95_003064 [Thielaviopsis punctulata]|uniref:PUM-HD domain-containing protein n=1 Tax=Thielaviopsis punctulata TaxID=72032 RepID=A0A0F4ZHL4_9PEZI|nr:hypothetical protein TD95_003064 [Thielaviopsis punctulata]
MDDSRLQSSQQPIGLGTDSPMTSFGTPPRAGAASGSGLGMTLPQPVIRDQRTGLPRRYAEPSPWTSGLNGLSSRPIDPSQQEYKIAYQKVQLIEKKRAEYERLREQRRRFEAEMQRLDESQRREEQELAQLTEEFQQLNGHQSEPTTPPHERYDSTAFPSLMARPNRYSMSNVASPPGLYSRLARTSLLQSHHAGLGLQRGVWDDQNTFRSVPVSRRNSDDEEKEEAVRQDPTSLRITNSRSRMLASDMDGLDQANTARFLFGTDSSAAAESEADYLRDTSLSGIEIVPSKASAISESLGASDWGVLSRSRSGFGSHAHQPIGSSSVPNSFRHSLDLKFLTENSIADAPSVTSNPISPPNGTISSPAGKLSGTYTPTEQSTMSKTPGSTLFNPISRLGVGSMAPRSTSQLGGDMSRESGSGFMSSLHGGAASFGPSVAGNSQTSAPGPHTFYPGANSFNPAPGSQPSGNGMMSMLSMGMQNMNMNSFQPSAAQAPSFAPASANIPTSVSPHAANGVTAPGGSSQGAFPSPPHARDSQARVIQNRRQQDSEANNKYNNLPLESVVGQIYQLCKDQHGCRYLQRRLEERNPEVTHTIWAETNQHVVELMTDPFGNYLCQKLLESCSEDERTTLISNASRDMVRIALNQHGTRALQKMIEFVHTDVQINLIVDALRYRVVELIQDLNGNHVIQKCLNKLKPENAQFIFDAVGHHCVDVGTHRHGCCVLQRCIDHANEKQQEWLIARITEHARVLVQDPYGNYVVQYIIDLNEPSYTEPMVAQFKNCIGALSRHKFSSNVIEKCIRCASDVSKDMIVTELLDESELERCLRDGFANYVVQTALDYATPAKKTALVDAIRPLLPSIRSTPHGRRIGGRINQMDTRGLAPADATGSQTPLRSAAASNGNQSRALSASTTPATGTMSPNVGTIGSGMASSAVHSGTATPRTNNASVGSLNYTNGLGLGGTMASSALRMGSMRGNGGPTDGEAQWI